MMPPEIAFKNFALQLWSTFSSEVEWCKWFCDLALAIYFKKMKSEKYSHNTVCAYWCPVMIKCVLPVACSQPSPSSHRFYLVKPFLASQAPFS